MAILIRLALFCIFFYSFVEAKESFKNFHEFKKREEQKFVAYKKSEDNLFREYLLKEWREYSTKGVESIYEQKKPSQIQEAPLIDAKPLGPKIYVETNSSIEDDSTPLEFKPTDFAISFFKTPLFFSIDKSYYNKIVASGGKDGVVAFFDAMAREENETLSSELQDVILKLGLNDWGVYLLVDIIAKEIYSDGNSVKLFKWFMLNRLGYDVKVAVSNGELILLHYSKQVIYEKESFLLGTKKYYALEYDKKPVIIHTYKDSYPNATKELDLSLAELPRLSKNIKNRELKFKYQNKEYLINIQYNQNLIDFMATYPQAAYAIYFNSKLEDITKKSLFDSLSKEINTLSSSEAINFLLSFVQNSFIYELDDVQFGREKPMFAEETLYYQKSDCEDRAVLFAYLVKNLLNIDVVGLRYGDHMATALNIPFDGDSVFINKKEYVIADPTYKNAKVGQSMPSYIAIKPKSYIIVKNL